MLIAGLETSCDESGVALYDTEKGLLGHALHSQVALHAEYGGVVPELASRDHIRKILPLLSQVLNDSGLVVQDLDGIAYTGGPGLVGALLCGASVARGLAASLGIPALAVHHLEGHLLAPMLAGSAPEFPFLALLVSGAHTQLVAVEAVGNYKVLGESLDDAVGEAFDKTAKLLGLDYPGGPLLARLAETGNPQRFRFPRPMTNRPGLDFSFSGLKTFAITTLEKNGGDDQTRADIARAFEDAVADTMLIKCRRALEKTGDQRLVVAGGVSANLRLRSSLDQLTAEVGVEVFYPPTEFCTDNGAMIAYAGALRLAAGEADSPGIEVRARWPMEELTAI